MSTRKKKSTPQPDPTDMSQLEPKKFTFSSVMVGPAPEKAPQSTPNADTEKKNDDENSLQKILEEQKKLELELRKQMKLLAKEKKKLETEKESLKQKKALDEGVGNLKEGTALKNLIASTLAEQLSQLLTPQPEGAKTTPESSLSTYPSSLFKNLYSFEQQNETGVSLPGHPLWASSPKTNPAMSAELSSLSDPSLLPGIADKNWLSQTELVSK